MLEEFIQANDLKAHIEPRLIRHPHGIKSELYFADTEWVLLIHGVHEKLDLDKVRTVLDAHYVEAPTEQECFDFTGYKPEFMPPISIYGVQAIMDLNLLERKTLYTFVSEDQTLIISPEEIQSMNENCRVEDIVRSK